MKIEYDSQHDIYSELAKTRRTVLQPGTATVGAWRQDRIMDRLRPLVSSEQTWLTVGDGNYGSEAAWIIANGGRAHASDYSVSLLEIAREHGLIDEFSQQNAEKLGFEDDSFDFVLIKEALHHFPRPWLALYEAMRVCRYGVVLFEPNGEEPFFISNLLRRLRGKPYHTLYGFEKVGNFKYAPNPRELEKFMLGLNLTTIAFCFFNDFWHSREADDAPMQGGNRVQQRLRSKVFETIRHRDRLAKLGLVPFGKVGCCMFKSENSYVNRDLKPRLQEVGWEVRCLPRNPFRNSITS